MGDVSRRGFLSGVVSGTVAVAGVASGLVIAARPEEVEAFGRGTNVQVGEVVPNFESINHTGGIVFDGEHRPIGVVTSVEVSYDHEDVSGFDNPYQVLAPSGRVTLKYTVISYGAVKLGVRHGR